MEGLFLSVRKRLDQYTEPKGFFSPGAEAWIRRTFGKTADEFILSFESFTVGQYNEGQGRSYSPNVVSISLTGFDSCQREAKADTARGC